MIIKEDDYLDALTYLKKMLDKGEKYIAFDDSRHVVDIKSLETFRTHYDAMEFCYECTTDFDVVSYLSIDSAYKALQEGIKNQSILIRSGGNIDITTTTLLYKFKTEDRYKTNEQFAVDHENKKIKKENSSKDKEPEVQGIFQMGKVEPTLQPENKQKKISPKETKVRTSNQKKGRPRL